VFFIDDDYSKNGDFNLQYPRETLARISRQTYPNIEINLVDDISTNGTKDQFSVWRDSGPTFLF